VGVCALLYPSNKAFDFVFLHLGSNIFHILGISLVHLLHCLLNCLSCFLAFKFSCSWIFITILASEVMRIQRLLHFVQSQFDIIAFLRRSNLRKGGRTHFFIFPHFGCCKLIFNYRIVFSLYVFCNWLMIIEIIFIEISIVCYLIVVILIICSALSSALLLLHVGSIKLCHFHRLSCSLHHQVFWKHTFSLSPVHQGRILVWIIPLPIVDTTLVGNFESMLQRGVPIEFGVTGEDTWFSSCWLHRRLLFAELSWNFLAHDICHIYIF